MNREILFRGKRIDNGEWVDGEIIIADDATFIAPSSGELYFVQKYDFRECSDLYEIALAEVIPSTVCQYTGLTDKNSKKIFEGDVMQLCSATYPCTVYWDGIGWAWEMNGKRRDIDLTREKMEVVGNIHEEVGE